MNDKWGLWRVSYGGNRKEWRISSKIDKKWGCITKVIFPGEGAMLILHYETIKNFKLSTNKIIKSKIKTMSVTNKIKTVDELLNSIKILLEGEKGQAAQSLNSVFFERVINKSNESNERTKLKEDIDQRIALMEEINGFVANLLFPEGFSLLLPTTADLAVMDAKIEIENAIKGASSPTRPSQIQLNSYKDRIKYFKINNLLPFFDLHKEIGFNVYPITRISGTNIAQTFALELVMEHEVVARVDDIIKYGRTHVYNYGDAGISSGSDIHPCAYAYGDPGVNHGLPTNC